jgi:hypothetical protein
MGLGTLRPQTRQAKLRSCLTCRAAAGMGEVQLLGSEPLLFEVPILSKRVRKVQKATPHPLAALVSCPAATQSFLAELPSAQLTILSKAN